jgi:hypothetical protein
MCNEKIMCMNTKNLFCCMKVEKIQEKWSWIWKWCNPMKKNHACYCKSQTIMSGKIMLRNFLFSYIKQILKMNN